MLLKAALSFVFAVSAMFSLGGCTTGLLYTSTVTPYDTNMDRTPVGMCKRSEGAKLFSIPTSRISASWSSRAIGKAAKEIGLQEIYYADLHTFRIFLGLWEKKTVIVCGK